MINGKSVLAIIPARGGSKGISRKNIREVGGKPLIAWTIEQARQSKYIDRLIVSSDDADIIQVAQAWGCEAPFVRPACLAQDDTPGIEAVLHAIEQVDGYNIVVLLQATSPLRTTADIDGCLELHEARGAAPCVSVSLTEQSPFWMYTLGDEADLQPLLKHAQAYTDRQSLPPVYALNGALYVASTSWLQAHRSFLTPETIGFVMDQQRALDIDTELDLERLSFQIGK